MGLRDIFKFRDLPESETSKPFLEHLEDLRWTIVKMSIALIVAMVVCFCFRSALVQVMQRPLRDIDPTIGALRALAITDSFTISFRLAFYAGIVISFPLLLYFMAEFVLPVRTRPYAIVLLFIFAAIISPTPDVLTMIAMALPLCLLYESCIWITWFVKRKEQRAAIDQRHG